MRYEDYDEKTRAQIDAALGRRRTKQKHAGRGSLGRKKQNWPHLVQADCQSIVVVIKRRIPTGLRFYDDDNLSGGSKKLRDIIAAIFGKKSDSATAGIVFEYLQERDRSLSKPETVIEIYEMR